MGKRGYNAYHDPPNKKTKHDHHNTCNHNTNNNNNNNSTKPLKLSITIQNELAPKNNIDDFPDYQVSPSQRPTSKYTHKTNINNNKNCNTNKDTYSSFPQVTYQPVYDDPYYDYDYGTPRIKEKQPSNEPNTTTYNNTYNNTYNSNNFDSEANNDNIASDPPTDTMASSSTPISTSLLATSPSDIRNPVTTNTSTTSTSVNSSSTTSSTSNDNYTAPNIPQSIKPELNNNDTATITDTIQVKEEHNEASTEDLKENMDDDFGIDLNVLPSPFSPPVASNLPTLAEINSYTPIREKKKGAKRSQRPKNDELLDPAVPLGRKVEAIDGVVIPEINFGQMLVGHDKKVTIFLECVVEGGVYFNGAELYPPCPHADLKDRKQLCDMVSYVKKFNSRVAAEALRASNVKLTKQYPVTLRFHATEATFDFPSAVLFHFGDVYISRTPQVIVLEVPRPMSTIPKKNKKKNKKDGGEEDEKDKKKGNNTNHYENRKKRREHKQWHQPQNSNNP